MVRVAGVVCLLLAFAGFLFADDLMQLKDQGGATKFTVDVNGKVGIGTSAPAQKLHIYGTADLGNAIHIDAQGVTGAQQASLNFLTKGDGATGLQQATTKGWHLTARGDAWTTTTDRNDISLSFWDGTAWKTPMHIDSVNGYVGIGTTSPNVNFALKATNPQAHLFSSVSGETAVDGYQLALSGTTALSWNFENGPMLFGTNNAERARITSDGNVGIGTTIPGNTLEVLKAAAAGGYGTGSAYGIRVNYGGGTYTGVHIGDFGYGSAGSIQTFNEPLALNPAGNNVGIGITNPIYQLQLSATSNAAGKPGGGMWSDSSSDARVKKEIQPFQDGLKVVEQIRPVKYKFNGLAGTPDDGTEFIGIIAQEIEKAAPYTVSTYMAKLNETDAEETQLLNFNGTALTYILINAVKELDGKNKDLKKDNDSLQKKCDDFESRCKAMEEQLGEESKKKEEFEARLKAIEEKLEK